MRFGRRVSIPFCFVVFVSFLLISSMCLGKRATRRKFAVL